MQSFKKYLNPLYKDIDEVADFSSLHNFTSLEEEEYPNLENITKRKVVELHQLLPRLDKLEQELEDQIFLINTESDLDSRADAKKIYNQILNKIQELVGRINNELLALDSPYFGKIKFLPYDSKAGKPLVLYIGKFALIDEQTHIPLITDWRSPIANLYYTNSGPTENVAFEAPVGERYGDLKQKRQFQISRARIRGIYDAKSGNVAADEFLLSQLNERIGKKLQDIVSTIQAQQNTIIRDDLKKPVLIQGVAGSGKTTILLHRLAYLFYTYKKEILPSNSLIIAPNQMFTDYVSDVLPDLGVEKVETETYSFWAKKVLNLERQLVISNEPEDLDFKGFKGSLEFLNILDEYFEIFESGLLDKIPYSRKDIIRTRYYELKEEFPNIEMRERLDLATDYAFAQKQFRQGNTGFYDGSYDSDVTLRKNIYSFFRKSCDIYTLYKNLYKTTLVTSDIAKYSLKGLTHSEKMRTYRMEDLAPMVYLFLKIEGAKRFERDYVMIDEAQDVSFVQLATLLEISTNGNISIAGDLAQSIIPPFYIKDWDDVLSLVKRITRNECKYYQLQRCYRTTVEIVEFANKIFKGRFPKSYKLPEAVLRHGDDVKIVEFDSNIEDLKPSDLRTLINIVKKQFEIGAVTCAVLCRNRAHADILFPIFKEHEEYIGRGVTSYSEHNYQSGLLILPIENAKGLEFDSVIFADANSDYYKEEDIDFKLMYVGITRALHRLFIVTKKGDKYKKILE